MRVLHISPGVGRTAFGLGTVVLNLAEHQQDQGVCADVWTTDSRQDIMLAAQESNASRSTITSFARQGPAALVYVPTMERALSGDMGKGYDVLHQHGIWTGISRATNVWRRAHRRPTVIAPHGSLDTWALRKSSWKKQLALAAYERDNLRHAACLHALARTEAQSIREFGLTNPIAVIPNGISAAWLHSTGDALSWREKYDIPKEARMLLFLGRITPKKGLPGFIEALRMVSSELNGWILVIAGADEFNHLKEIQELVQRLNLEPMVRYVGPQFGQDKRNAFAAADVFILPSASEGAPMVVLEALGAGVPALATRASPWEELVTYKCGWWTEIDRDAMASALRKVAGTSESELAAMGRRGNTLVAGKYDWSGIASMTHSLYRWLLGQGPQPDFIITNDDPLP